MQLWTRVLGVVLLTGATCMFAQTNTFPTTGNVGIGTTSPSSLLTVSGGFANISTNNSQYTMSQLDDSTSPIATPGGAFGSVFGGDAIIRAFWGVSVDLNAGSGGDSISAP